MKRGTFPGQEEALRARAAELSKQADQRATRRMFLGLGVGGVVGAVSGGWAVFVSGRAGLGSNESESSEGMLQQLDARHEWARRLAMGSLDDLCEAQVTYLATVNHAEKIDDVMWLGVERLANAAIEGDPRMRRGIHTFILALERNRSLSRHRMLWLELVRSRFR